MYSDEYSKKVAENLVTNHLFLIAEDHDNQKVGFICGLITPHLLNPSIKVLAEALFWVDENRRTSGAGSALLDAYIAVGKEHADWLTMTLEIDSPMREESLLKRGFKLKEKSYYMECI